MTNPQQNNQPSDEDRNKIIEIVCTPEGIPPFILRYTLAALDRYTQACYESRRRRREQDRGAIKP